MPYQMTKILILRSDEPCGALREYLQLATHPPPSRACSHSSIPRSAPFRRTRRGRASDTEDPLDQRARAPAPGASLTDARWSTFHRRNRSCGKTRVGKEREIRRAERKARRYKSALELYRRGGREKKRKQEPTAFDRMREGGEAREEGRRREEFADQGELGLAQLAISLPLSQKAPQMGQRAAHAKQRQRMNGRSPKPTTGSNWTETVKERTSCPMYRMLRPSGKETRIESFEYVPSSVGSSIVLHRFMSATCANGGRVSDCWRPGTPGSQAFFFLSELSRSLSFGTSSSERA
ncbi:hypothetical protein B0H13DRAFT_1868435 [Mycena leptocephala]|nr:hypothetical protein B0H13DRAFT_1868435 [Mycena leptocephala]